jgi:putative mRNA 3-end processing factor
VIYLRMRFLGGAGEVGRSAFVIEDEKNILLDCGLKVENIAEYPLEIGKVDACILSHAHLDHSGYLPTIYRDASPPTFTTQPTMELVGLLIEDAMKIAKRRHDKPIYSRADFNEMLSKYVPCEYGLENEFDDYTITMRDAGHILGSAVSSIEKARSGRTLAYTGDFKLWEQTLQKGADPVKCDILVMEATYGSGDHPDRDNLVKGFIEDIKSVVDNGGTALVPVFAVGRSQEVLAILEEHGLADRTYLDGMARAATEIALAHKRFLKNGRLLAEGVNKASVVEMQHARRNAVKGGKIILTTSGMLTGGPVLNYITQLNRNSKIFLTGFQVEGTNGHKLLQGKPLIIDGKKFSVKNEVGFYDLSAHAGKTELKEYARLCSPEEIVLVHGSTENIAAAADSLSAEGFKVHTPKVGDTIDFEF